MPQSVSHDFVTQVASGLGAFDRIRHSSLYTIAQYHLCLYNLKPHISHQGAKGLCGANLTVYLWRTWDSIQVQLTSPSRHG
jgi:hypothetical protein